MKVPSEDEQSEFNRRYSRDIRKRRKNLKGEGDDNEEVEDDDRRKTSPGIRRRTRASDNVEDDRDSDNLKSDSDEDKDEDKIETTRRRVTPMRNATRNLRYSSSRMAESSEEEPKREKQPKKRESTSSNAKNVDETSEHEEHMNDSKIRRSSRILTKNFVMQR